MQNLSHEQITILTEGVEEFNDTLLTMSINLSGQAFNNALRLGCGLLSVPLLIILVITYIVRDGLDFSAVAVYSLAGLLISVIFSILVANRAKYLVVQEKYQQDVNPDIVRFLAEHDFKRSQFDELADEILAVEAPLRQYLVQPTNDTIEDELVESEEIGEA